jgi:hypothetical protein
MAMTMNDTNQDDRDLFAAMANEFNPGDPTELPRRLEIHIINAKYSDDEAERYRELVAEYGIDNVWDTDTLTECFIVDGFLAPYCTVTRRSDGVKGSVRFCHSPRFYFDFMAS